MIKASTLDDESGKGLWIEASETDSRLFAYVANAEAVDEAGPMTVFWHGRITVDTIKTVVQGAEDALTDLGIFERGTLYAYGSRETIFDPVFGGVSRNIDASSDAFRAELAGPEGLLTIWAYISIQADNVSDENIGVCFDRLRFYKLVKPLLVDAVEATTNHGTVVVDRLLQEIVAAIDARKRQEDSHSGYAF